MKTIDEIRDAFHLVHRVATGQSDRGYMSIPADPERDADLIVSAAIDELGQARAELAKAQARCAELEAALDRAATAISQGRVDEANDSPFALWVKMEADVAMPIVEAALASDGTSALAAVRLAQRALTDADCVDTECEACGAAKALAGVFGDA